MPLRALLTLLFTITFVISPAFTSPFSGFRADQLPVPQIDPPIQPEGYAFAIWGLIYGWLVVSAVFGLWKRGQDAGWNAARGPLLISLALGTPWLAVANISALWATVLIFAMAVPAILALLAAPRHDRWLLQAPLGLYAGWLTAASFVSLGSTAAGYGILTDSVGWAVIGIIAALGVAVAVLWAKPQAPEYGLTVIWALVAIIVANGVTANPISLLAGAGVLAIGGLLAANTRRVRPT